MKCTHEVYAALKALKPDFSSLADEIAEPRPDMNIEVTAFTVGEKSINSSFSIKYIIVLNLNEVLRIGLL